MNQLTDQERLEAIASHVESIITLLGEDTTREGLVRTPMRAAKALAFLTSGYRTNPDEVVGQAIFEHEGSQIVVVKDIEFYSLCEHHVLPFFGTISLGYIPNGKIVGLSKLARIVDVFARRLQVQERFYCSDCRRGEQADRSQRCDSYLLRRASVYEDARRGEAACINDDYAL